MAKIKRIFLLWDQFFMRSMAALFDRVVVSSDVVLLLFFFF